MMPEPSIQDLTAYNELIISLITLRMIFKDTEKIKKATRKLYELY